MDSGQPELVVVKIGGGLLSSPGALEAVLSEVSSVARRTPLLIVPGGGPFADAVRVLASRVGLTDDEAHWMAVLGMDQYANLIASRLHGGVLVSTPDAIATATNGRQIPVLAPYRWLRDADPLPHSWDVTSDSIAAWVAGQVGACRLVLVKPGGVRASGDLSLIVDPFFASALPAGIEVEFVPADQATALHAACVGREPEAGSRKPGAGGPGQEALQRP